MIAVDRQLLTDRVGHVSRDLLRSVLAGLDVILGREELSFG